MGRHTRRLLKFAIDYPGWHGYAKNDPPISRALRSLERLGLIEVDRKIRMFRLRPSVAERESKKNAEAATTA